MAAMFLPGNLQDEATCSVCLEFFKDPVSIECGHNFCRACIIKSWKDLEMDFPCPQCREVFQQKSFRPNRQLANMAEIISQFALRGAKGAEEDGLCAKHREALKLYCKDDRRTICVVCDRSREHRPHAVVPVDEASEEYKVVVLAVCPSTLLVSLWAFSPSFCCLSSLESLRCHLDGVSPKLGAWKC